MIGFFVLADTILLQNALYILGKRIFELYSITYLEHICHIQMLELLG